MKTASATKIANSFGYWTDEALTEPIGIERHGKVRVVMISAREYERLTSGKCDEPSDVLD